MNKKLFCYFLLFLLLTNIFAEQVITLNNGRKAVLFDDFTWRYLEQEKPIPGYPEIKDNEIPSFLRQGIKATRQEIITAIEIYNQGWGYTMPQPKSSQAAWGNGDGRTTWWYGWWYNEKMGLYSDSTPRKSENGLYLGDNQNNANRWRNGGSRGRPDIYMYLLSKSGGPPQG